MTYQPPQNILAALLQTRQQQGARQMPAQVQNIDMSQPQPMQMPQQPQQQGGGLLSGISNLAGYAPNTMFGYQMPSQTNPQTGQQQNHGALGMISQMAGYAPNTMFGYGNSAANGTAFQNVLSNLMGGK